MNAIVALVAIALMVAFNALYVAAEFAATASAEQVLERFRRDRTHAALIVDEYGGTLGIVTMDDVIAEVMDNEIRPVDVRIRTVANQTPEPNPYTDMAE